MLRHALVAFVSAALVVACSSSDSSGGGSSGTSGATPSAPAPPPPPAPTPAKGTVGGHSFTVAAGIAYPRTLGSANGYEIFLSDKPIDCNAVTLEGSTTIDVDVQGTPPATATNFMAIDPNVSSIDATHSEADFNVVDATCGSLLSESSKSGNIYFTAFDAAHAAGNLSISFGKPGGADDGTITGTFDVPVCAKFPTPACTPH